ncbi:MAG: serine O-acetyltransferase [Rhizobiales bacterium]|nr:serine O-acetyltransferase [Hyphomicrobiales bacterium]
MSKQQEVTNLLTIDPVWQRIRQEAQDFHDVEPALEGFVFQSILVHDNLERCVAYRMAQLLGTADVSSLIIQQIFDEAIGSEAKIIIAIRADIVAFNERDPAAKRYIDALLYFKGFHAVITHRIANWLFEEGRKDLAFFLQSCSSRLFGVDIHPRVKIGKGFFLDHATGVVIGETAIIEDDVSILQGVTLGGTGKDSGDRHPKVRRGVLIGAGAKILGNIEIGHCVRVGAGSVVLKSIPANKTVVGVPAKVVGAAGCSEPALKMDQIIIK